MGILKKLLIGLLLTAAVLFLLGFFALKLLVTPEQVVKPSPLRELTSEEKLEDFKYLYATLKDSFPFFEIEKDKTGFDWLGNKDKFEKQIMVTKNNVEFYNTLKGIVNRIQNGHTAVLSPSYYDSMVPSYSSINNYAWEQVLTQSGVKEKYKGWGKIIIETKVVLPIKLKYIEGRYVVTEDFKNIKKGYVIDSINDKAIDAYLNENMDRYYLNYDYKRDKLYLKSSMIIVAGGRDYKVTAKAQNNQRIVEYLTPIKYEQNTSASLNDSSSEEKILKKNEVAYLNVKSMSNRTLITDGKKILEFYRSIKDYPYLVIDIRGNGGGTDEYWQRNIVEPLIPETKSSDVAITYKGNYIKPFLRGRGIITKSIDKLPKQFYSKYASTMNRFIATTRKVKPRNSVSFKGKIYLLVDDYVYSSSETFAAFCKATGFAELVGTITGGDGIGIDPCVMALPNSGLVIRFSLDMGINSDGSVNEKVHTKPNIYVEPIFQDLVKGKDSILNRVLKICNK
jgi:C-terminal processing protease CtpA/Prc